MAHIHLYTACAAAKLHMGTSLDVIQPYITTSAHEVHVCMHAESLAWTQLWPTCTLVDECNIDLLQ